MRFIIFLGGGIGVGWMIFTIVIFLSGGAVLAHQDNKKFDALEKAARQSLMPPETYYDSIWHNSRAITYFQKGNYPKAIKAWRKAFEFYPDPTYLNIIAAAYYYQGDFDNAFTYWEVALENYPDFEHLRKNFENAKKARKEKEKNPSWKPALVFKE